MSEQPTLDSLIARMTEVVRAAYAAGRSEAMSTILRAAQTEIEADMPPMDRPPAVARKPLPLELARDVATRTVNRATPTGRAARGAVKFLVRDFVLGAGHPVTESEFGDKHPNVGRSSRYAALRTLEEEGVIMRGQGGWVSVPKGGESPDAGASGNATPDRNGAT